MRSPTPLDKQRIRRAFDRAAAHYDEAAVLQNEVAVRLCERLDYIRIDPGRVLDGGCGTGQISLELAARYPKARIVGLDLAPGMLAVARNKNRGWLKRKKNLTWLCADIECVPLAAQSVDLVISNLTLQWCDDLEKGLAECRRILRPGGLLLFTTFGPDTLYELRQSWQQAERTLFGQSNGAVHVNEFIDMHLIGDAMLAGGWQDPVMDVERLTVTYDSVFTLMRDLKTIGANNAARERARHLTGKAMLQSMQQAYEAYRRDGLLPATYEVIYGHAWAPAQVGEIAVPFEGLHP